MSFEPPVGIIGVGLMGEVLARRLVSAGFGVVGFDIDPAKTVRLQDFGGRPAASIADVARAANPIVLAVFNTDQVEEVVEKEILPALGKPGRERGKVVMCTSTCDPDRVTALAGRVTKQGLRFLETPVSGSSEQVRQCFAKNYFRFLSAQTSDDTDAQYMNAWAAMPAQTRSQLNQLLVGFVGSDLFIKRRPQ